MLFLFSSNRPVNEIQNNLNENESNLKMGTIVIKTDNSNLSTVVTDIYNNAIIN